MLVIRSQQIYYILMGQGQVKNYKLALNVAIVKQKHSKMYPD